MSAEKTKNQQYWLMKSEPGEFSISDLKKKKRHYWDGVRNYEARNFMKNSMKIGDLVIFYHSNSEITGPAGIAKVVSEAYPDHTQWKKKHKYFDPRTSKTKPLWWMVDVGFVREFKHIIPRGILREIPALKDMILWKRGRLSVTPLTAKEFSAIVQIGLK